MENNTYYKIPISMFKFWFWLIIMLIFIAISGGLLFPILIIPAIIYLKLKNTEYLYNNKELIIRKGLINKLNRNIALNKIEEININLKILNLVVQARPISLTNIKNINEEADKLIKVWNKIR